MAAHPPAAHHRRACISRAVPIAVAAQRDNRSAFPRVAAQEWLDSDSASTREVKSALRSLRFVNRWFGGNRVHRVLLAQVACGRRHLSVLEVAAGSGTALVSASRSLARRGVVIEPTLLDRRTSHLPAKWPRDLAQPRLVTADALALPFADSSIDVVSCCLFLHHLDAVQAAQFLAEALRVSRVAVVINDLERTRLHYALARGFALLDPSRLSRHDGPVSVRQAWSRQELRAMLQAAGARWQLQRHYLFRHGAILWA